MWKRNHSAWARATLAALWLAVGCDSPSTPEQPQSQAPPSPEQRLKNAMSRLQNALDHAKAAASSGVRSERTFTYQLIEPGAEDARPTAEVFIETSVSLRPQRHGSAPVLGQTEEGEEKTAEVDRQRFLLVYDEERWELAEPPDEELTETERICFQYALSDG
ncbi:MAG TPA: hypothetical protein PKC18_18680 [Lacipirellulaceae bacterium]|nr:hypothetical protein [Lacipirellulaceae bacterium]